MEWSLFISYSTCLTTRTGIVSGFLCSGTTSVERQLPGCWEEAVPSCSKWGGNFLGRLAEKAARFMMGYALREFRYLPPLHSFEESDTCTSLSVPKCSWMLGDSGSFFLAAAVGQAHSEGMFLLWSPISMFNCETSHPFHHCNWTVLPKSRTMSAREI